MNEISCKSRLNSDTESQLQIMKNLKIIKDTELQELQKLNSFENVENHTPSYCDRIIYRTKINMTPMAYGSYTNKFISRSSHDLVYGIFELPSYVNNSQYTSTSSKLSLQPSGMYTSTSSKLSLQPSGMYTSTSSKLSLQPSGMYTSSEVEI